MELLFHMWESKGMKDLNEIAVFVRVAQQGSFSKAAKHLAMPVSTVSRKVSDLEGRIGMTLMQRTTRKLQLTGAGERYYRQCLDLLEGFDEAETKLTELHRQPEGLLRVTVPVGMASGRFVDFLSGFLKKYIHVQLELVITNQYIDLIAENVDVAIRFGPLTDSSLIARRLGTGEHFLVAAPAYLKTVGEPKEPSDLKQFECLTYRTRGDGNVWELSRGKNRQKVRVGGRVQASDMYALKELALRGHGLALLPELYCTNELKSGAFRHVLPEWRSPLSLVHAVYANRRFLPARLSLFLGELEGWEDAEWRRG
jgi:DNA-binding transcriptional LysR family regulator